MMEKGRIIINIGVIGGIIVCGASLVVGITLFKKRYIRKEEKEEEEEIEDVEDIEDINAGKGEMVKKRLRKSLEKSGYRIVGKHSGVKMCRWTKSMLRGRGGCYKLSFYGISSHRCMETTPCLACANQCVFCWRHHKTPVARSFKWAVDDPNDIFNGFLSSHRVSFLKQMKGVPGVTPQRLQEAFDVKHCALSLVGEPILYPKINQFLDLLHESGISSFLVTNGQFPQEMRLLNKVTQLYLSVDSPTKQGLQEIDRPIFSDFWERHLASVDAMRLKTERTVFRLTLVKGWNASDQEIADYSSLITRGKPDFIELKGMTFSGSFGSSSSITLENVPFHHEVVSFAHRLCDTPELREEYGLACQHEHSCCVLIAKLSFYKDGCWNTWIDFEKFHSLVAKGQEFSASDYLAPTPDWALFESSEKGFDPSQTRFHRNKPVS